MATPKKTNKSAFIRAHSHLKPAQIVAVAKKAGLSFSVEYVYSIRQNAKKARLLANPRTASAKTDTQFRALTLQIGVRRARELVSEVETQARAIAS